MAINMSRTYRNLLPLLLVAFLTTNFCGTAYSQLTESDKFTYFNLTVTAVTSIVENEIQDKEAILRQYGEVRDGILAKLEESKSDSRQNVRTSIKGRITGDRIAVVEALIDQIGETGNGIDLVRSLESINVTIELFIEGDIDIAIYQRPNSGYNDTYDRYVTAYGALNDHYKAQANHALFGDYGINADGTVKDMLLPKRPLPDKNRITVSRCATPTGTCYSYLEDANDHQLTCKEKHGVSGETNVVYWLCQTEDGLCTRSSEHWVPCRGEGCNVLFPPPTVTYHAPASLGAVGFTTTDYHDHEVTCTEEVYSIFNGILNYQATCGRKYFTCQGGCQHNSAEGVFPRETQGYITFDHAANLVSITPYQSVTWYIKHSSYGSGLGATAGSESGDGSKKTSSLSYTFTDMHSTGTYTVTVVVAYPTNSSQYSYTVHVYPSQSEDGGGSQQGSGSEDDTLCSWCSEYGLTEGCGSCWPTTPAPAPTPEPESTPSPALNACSVHPASDPGDHSDAVCSGCGATYFPCLSLPGECPYGYHSTSNY